MLQNYCPRRKGEKSLHPLLNKHCRTCVVRSLSLFPKKSRSHVRDVDSTTNCRFRCGAGWLYSRLEVERSKYSRVLFLLFLFFLWDYQSCITWWCIGKWNTIWLIISVRRTNCRKFHVSSFRNQLQYELHSEFNYYIR